MAVNKVVYGNETLIDLTGDTITADGLKKGQTAHDKSGAIITGTNTYDSNTQDATANAAEILLGKTAYIRGKKIEGTMPNNESMNGTISGKSQKYNVPIGFHDGSGYVQIDETEQGKMVPGNIKQGVTILGVTGEYSGEAVNLQSKNVTPSAAKQTIQPDAGYDALSSVVVNAIPYAESDNSAGGTTVTIG